MKYYYLHTLIIFIFGALFPIGQYYCPPYTATSTNSATVNYTTCNVHLCGGDTVTMSMCGQGGSYSGGTPYLTISVHLVIIRRVYDLYLLNVVVWLIVAVNARHVIIAMMSIINQIIFPTTFSDTYLALFNSTGALMTSNDDACSPGSEITFTAPGGSTDCTTYQLREGCFGTNTCSGTVAVYPGPSPAPTIMSTSEPTSSTEFHTPTIMPTPVPTVTGKYSVARTLIIGATSII